MKKTLLFLLISTVIASADSRLTAIKSVYVDTLGDDKGAPKGREYVMETILTKTPVELAKTRESASAVLTGIATSSQAGSLSTDPFGRVSGGSREVMDISLRLVDLEGNTLWVFDKSKCRHSSPFHRPQTVSDCFVEQFKAALGR